MRSKFQERRMKKVPTTLGRRGYARTIADMVRTYIQYTYFNFCHSGWYLFVYIFISYFKSRWFQFNHTFIIVYS